MSKKPLAPPDWVWELSKATYVPDMEWNMLLRGYESWHLTGAKFSDGKGQGADYKNYGVTLPSVAMSLRRYDEGVSGSVRPRSAEVYWNAVIQASVAVVCRMRAQRYCTEASAAIAFGLPEATKLHRRAKRYVSKCHLTKCPRFYADKLPEIPSVPLLMGEAGETTTTTTTEGE